LIHKYIHGKFKDEYQVTVGVDFSSKTVLVEEQPVQLQIWDTVQLSFMQCGQDVYKAITNNFYRGAAAVFLVYAINNRESFDRLQQWLE
jgi:GTPase SAR1 family protein